jgi:hypothetical protein
MERLEHDELILAEQKAIADSNSIRAEKRRAYRRAWGKINRKRLLSQFRKYYWENRDRILAYNRAYRYKNIQRWREYNRIYMRAWRLKHPNYVCPKHKLAVLNFQKRMEKMKRYMLEKKRHHIS